jgi:hypothetical protein
LFIRDANIVQKKLKSAKSIVINTIKIWSQNQILKQLLKYKAQWRKFDFEVS